MGPQFSRLSFSPRQFVVLGRRQSTLGQRGRRSDAERIRSSDLSDGRFSLQINPLPVGFAAGERATSSCI